MATIRAKGKTEFGEKDIAIEGRRKVEKLSSSDRSFAIFFKDCIRRSEGHMANAYHPEADTMLQAYAFCTNLFELKDIHVDGDIGEMESREGVVY